MERLRFGNWATFRSWLDVDRQILPVYWRGQKDPSWPLASSFERRILWLNGGWESDASNVYPYGGRLARDADMPAHVGHAPARLNLLQHLPSPRASSGSTRKTFVLEKRTEAVTLVLGFHTIRKTVLGPSQHAAFERAGSTS